MHAEYIRKVWASVAALAELSSYMSVMNLAPITALSVQYTLDVTTSFFFGTFEPFFRHRAGETLRGAT